MAIALFPLGQMCRRKQTELLKQKKAGSLQHGTTTTHKTHQEKRCSAHFQLLAFLQENQLNGNSEHRQMVTRTLVSCMTPASSPQGYNSAFKPGSE